MGDVLRDDVLDLVRPATHVLLDVDGVLCLADEPFGDAGPVLAALGELAHVVVTTNDSRRGVAEQRARITASGVSDDHTVIASADAVVARLRDLGATRIGVVGTPGFRAHLRAAGLTIVDDADGGHSVVVVGCVPDPTTLDVAATLALIGDLPWLASNQDLLVPTTNGPIPGTGATLAILEPLLGRAPEICGKPSRWMSAAVEERVGPLGATVVIGDGVHTDLAWARANGWPCVHIATDDAGADLTLPTLAALLA